MPYIITDNDSTVIYGVGETAEASWQNMLCELGYTDADVTPEGEEVPWFLPEIRRSNFCTVRATAALIAEVEERGGAISWGMLPDRTACTLAEEARP